MSTIDRRGLTVGAISPSAGSILPNADLAVKTPCACATTANISLSGLQTIDGHALLASERVLVKDQTDQTQNGIYAASSGNWKRTTDADSSSEWSNGTRVYVISGTVNGASNFVCTSADPIILDTSSITFVINQSVVNDTNVTGSIAGRVITLGWSGTLALSRLAQGADGQIIVGQTSSAPIYKTLSGEATLNAAGALSISRTFSPTMTGAWQFNNTLHILGPTSSSLKGFQYVQSGTNTETCVNDFPYAQIFIASDGLNVTGAGQGATGLQVQLLPVGTNAKGQRAAFRALLQHTTTSTMATGGDFIGSSGIAQASQPNGGSDTGANAHGTVYGTESQGGLSSGALNYYVASGGEFQGTIFTGASAAHRWALSLAAYGDLRGATSDAALAITSQSTPYSTSILLSNIAGSAPIPTTGTVIGTDGSSVTATNFADLHTYTFSGDILYFNNFRVTGAGNVSSGSSVNGDATVAVANTNAGAGAMARYTATSNAGVLSIEAISTAGGAAGIVNWNGGALLIDSTNASGSIALRTGVSATTALSIDASQVVSFVNSVQHPTVANASIATAMSSVGPTGSHTTVQEWFPIKNASGTIRYVPGF